MSNRIFKMITMFMLTIVIFSSCEDDENLENIRLEKEEAEVFVGESTTVNIVAGNSGYEVTSTDSAVATTTVSGEVITITGVAKGVTAITIKDSKGKSATLEITVKSAIVDATTPRFKWINTIELDKDNNWGTTILTDRIAVTNVVDGKQYVLMWSGGFSVGNKTNAKLRLLENGKSPVEETLTGLEIQESEANLYVVIFNKGAQRGEAVLIR